MKRNVLLRITPQILLFSNGVSSFDDTLKTESMLNDMHIIPPMFSAILPKLDPLEACGLDGLLQGFHLVHMLRKEMCSRTAASCFPTWWKISSVVPVFKNSGELTSYIIFWQCTRGSNQLRIG